MVLCKILFEEGVDKITVKKEAYEKDKVLVQKIASYYDILSYMRFDKDDSNLPQDYNYNDYSLSEIAENHEISRNAVHDTLKKVEKALEYYEEKLNLYSKSEELEKLLDNLSKHTNDEGLAIIKRIKEME